MKPPSEAPAEGSVPVDAHEPLMERMSALIAAELEAQELSQAEFARRTGVTQKHINRVLNGQQAASLPMLDYWAHVLGCRWLVSLTRGDDRDG